MGAFLVAAGGAQDVGSAFEYRSLDKSGLLGERKQKSGDTHLCRAASIGDVEMVRLLLEQGGQDPNETCTLTTPVRNRTNCCD